MMSAECRSCSEVLTEGNWYKSFAEAGNRLCRACAKGAAKTYRKTYRRKHPFTEAAKAKAAQKAREWRAANPEKATKAVLKWRRANPEKRAAISARRRARERYAQPVDPKDYEAIQRIYALARRLTELTGRQYHVDHLVPLSKGGLHRSNNLVAMEGRWNRRKHAHILPSLIEFFRA